jgi:hypothetical protein
MIKRYKDNKCEGCLCYEIFKSENGNFLQHFLTLFSKFQCQTKLSFVYLYIPEQYPKEGFHQFSFLNKKFPLQNDIFYGSKNMFGLRVKSNQCRQIMVNLFCLSHLWVIVTSKISQTKHNWTLHHVCVKVIWPWSYILFTKRG